MSFLGTLLSGSAAKPIDALGNVFDKLFTSDDERLQAKIVLDRMRQEPHLLQAEINKIEASHRSWFVAGWRPALGWVCAVGLVFPFIINPFIQWFTGLPGPELPTDALMTLVVSLLGLGGLRTVEKFGGFTK